MAELQELGKHDVGTEKAGEPEITDVTCNSHWVLPAVQEILDDNPQFTYSTSDVYAACESGAATLWATADGFVVTTGETDTFTGDRTLLIWVAWAYKRGMDLVTRHQDFFIQKARDGGYKNLETRSAVPELKDHLVSQGWRVDTIVYTRDA
jgi:hypothetical protein|tara:strand:- start:194 stop:646 length:453 start_codon:yes stop_codon:yes gene_type:complete